MNKAATRPLQADASDPSLSYAHAAEPAVSPPFTGGSAAGSPFRAHGGIGFGCEMTLAERAESRARQEL